MKAETFDYFWKMFSIPVGISFHFSCWWNGGNLYYNITETVPDPQAAFLRHECSIFRSPNCGDIGVEMNPSLMYSFSILGHKLTY